MWRIATRGPSWAADDLSGNGSPRSAGRWNSTGMPVGLSLHHHRPGLPGTVLIGGGSCPCAAGWWPLMFRRVRPWNDDSRLLPGRDHATVC
ncbi:MAG: RES domain-containing protein [Cyanobium sp.]